MGNFAKAKSLIEEALSIYKITFPEDHITLAEANLFLSRIYQCMKKYKEAKNLLERSRAIYERTYGKTHRETGHVLTNIGQTYLLDGNFEEAEKFLCKALEIFEKSSPLDAFIVFEELAQLYLQKANTEVHNGDVQQFKIFKNQGRAYLDKALDIVKTNFPKDSPHITRIQVKLKGFDL